MLLILGNADQRRAESLDIAVDHGNPEFGLRSKMVVDAGLADAEAVGNVLIAERAVAAGLDQRLGEIEDLFGGV